MGFAALFEWQEDGSLRARSPLNSETWIDLRFARDETGRWMLHRSVPCAGSTTPPSSSWPTASGRWSAGAGPGR